MALIISAHHPRSTIYTHTPQYPTRVLMLFISVFYRHNTAFHRWGAGWSCLPFSLNTSFHNVRSLMRARQTHTLACVHCGFIMLLWFMSVVFAYCVRAYCACWFCSCGYVWGASVSELHPASVNRVACHIQNVCAVAVACV